MAAGNGRPVATYRGNDSGSTCPTPCQVPPRELTGLQAGKNTVYINKIPVMVNGESLSPSQGNTCTNPSSVCSVERVVKANGTVFHMKQPIAHIGDKLNIANNITIISVTNNVFSN
jgi:uncharacterized Zn-binding protein involved in type VI secretion